MLKRAVIIAAIASLPSLALTQQLAQQLASQAAGTYEVNGGVRWSDNLGRGPNANSGLIGTVGVVLDARRKTGRLQFDSKADLDYAHYFTGNFKDEVLGQFVGSASYALIPQSLIWVTEDHFGQVTADFLQSPGPGNSQILNVFSTGPDLRLRLANALALRISGRYGRDDYQTSPYDATRLSGETAIERRPSEATLLSVGAGHERVDYQNAIAKPGNFSVDHYFGNYAIKAARTSFDFQGGYSESKGGLAQLRGPTGHFALERLVGSSSSFRLAAQRTLNTVSQGTRASDYILGVARFARAEVLTGSLYFSSTAELGYRWQHPRTTLDIVVAAGKETDHRDIRPDRDLQSLGAKLSHRLTPLADAILYASWSRDTLYDARILNLPIGDFRSTESTIGATYRLRFSRVMVASLDLAHTQRTADIGPYRENAIWLRLGYSPQAAVVEPK